jgi:hypothetical protein
MARRVGELVKLRAVVVLRSAEGFRLRQLHQVGAAAIEGPLAAVAQLGRAASGPSTVFAPATFASARKRPTPAGPCRPGLDSRRRTRTDASMQTPSSSRWPTPTAPRSRQRPLRSAPPPARPRAARCALAGQRLRLPGPGSDPSGLRRLRALVRRTMRSPSLVSAYGSADLAATPAGLRRRLRALVRRTDALASRWSAPTAPRTRQRPLRVCAAACAPSCAARRRRPSRVSGALAPRGQRALRWSACRVR